MRSYSKIDLLRFARIAKENPDVKPIDLVKSYDEKYPELSSKEKCINLAKALRAEKLYKHLTGEDLPPPENEQDQVDSEQGFIYREPICLTVKYALAFEFRALVESIEGCSIKNVIEIKSGELLQYWIDCPKEKENQITDMAFMTWIKNPVFQKYYQGTKAFNEIAEKYILERENG